MLNLKSNLQKQGKDLLVTIGNPEIIIPLCCVHRDRSYTTYVLEEVCSEERAVENAVEEALRIGGHELRKVGWGAALLYHDADLPFKKDANNKTDIPNVFTKYRGKQQYTDTPAHACLVYACIVFANEFVYDVM